eukprot:6492822-Pyramimonas_sp.AAC.1
MEGAFVAESDKELAHLVTSWWILIPRPSAVPTLCLPLRPSPRIGIVLLLILPSLLWRSVSTTQSLIW